MAVLVALLALPVLLLDYQSGADAADDSVTLSVDESGEFTPAPVEIIVPDNTTSAIPTTSLAIDATQATDAQTTVAPTTSTSAPTSAAPSTTQAPTPTTTEAPAATEPAPTTPPDTQPPATTPPGTSPPDTAPPGTNPPDTQPPDTVPPATQPPETTPPETTPPTTTPPVAGPVTPVAAEDGDPTADQWWQLRQCESTNNYGAVSATGKFRGAYQFSQATWDWVANSFHPELSGQDPAAAIPGNQDAMALALTRMQSPGAAWPKCSRTAGIA